jgi:hypothetical protein
MTLKITATVARTLARKFGRAINRGDTAQVTPYMNALKAKGTGTMTTSQRQEFRAMLNKVTEKQTRRQATGTAKKKGKTMTLKRVEPGSAAMKTLKKREAQIVASESRGKKPKGWMPDEDLINKLVANNSMNQLQRRLRAAKTASQKKLLRDAIKNKKKLADAPRRYKWGASEVDRPYD